MHIILPILLFFIFALEGLGVNLGREVVLLLTCLLIPVLFVHIIFNKKKIVFPKVASILFIVFLSLTLISTFISVNISQSIQHFLYFTSVFFIFLLSYNYKNELIKPVTILIFTLSSLFSIYFLVLNFHFLNLFTPEHGYQFVYSRFTAHNHLGDFLSLPIILCSYYLYKRKQYSLTISYQLLAIIYLLFSIPLVLFSYSRSAYLTIAATLIFLHVMYLQEKRSWSTKWILRVIIFVTILSIGYFLVATTHQAQKQPITSYINKSLVQEGGLEYKEILGNRLEYARQSLISIQKNPILGIGPNNFQYVSKQYSKASIRATTTTHNIFLEILVGQGILGLLPFLGLILMILLKSRKNALFFAMLAMLINFQTDYTYQIYSFFLLFVVIAGILQTDTDFFFSKKMLNVNSIFRRMQKFIPRFLL